jgi:hypothetical protein
VSACVDVDVDACVGVGAFQNVNMVVGQGLQPYYDPATPGIGCSTPVSRSLDLY